MKREFRVAGYVLVGIAAGVLIALAAIQFISRTGPGRGWVRDFALGWLEDRVHGEVSLGRLSGGGLLGGVTIHDFSIADEAGRPFVIADSARVAYDWKTLVRGSIILDHLTLYSPDITIERLPGDTAWNYEHIFADTTPGGDGGRSLIMFEDATIVDGTVTVRTPWQPEPPIEPPDSARLILEPVPGGLAQVWRFDRLAGELNRVIWESPVEEGKLFEVSSLSGRGFLWEDPFTLNDVRGTITLVDSILSFDVPRLVMGGSRAAAVGRVVLGEENRYDVRLDGQQLAFVDLQWLLPELPEDGHGRLILHIQSQQPAGLLWLAEEAQITAPGTNVSGTFGIVTGDTLYFTRVSLVASPLDLTWIERMMPDGLPVDGLMVGTVELRGPISALETSGSARLTRADGATSGGRWRGTLDMRGPPRARPLLIETDDFDFAVFAGWQPALADLGQVAGRAELRGRLDVGGLELTGVLTPIGSDIEGERVSALTASGWIRRSATEAPIELDLTVDAEPLGLAELRRIHPRLAALTGEARGRIRLRGAADALTIAADLTAALGRVTFGGTVERVAGIPRVAGAGSVRDVQLGALGEALPEGEVSGEYVVDLAGSDLASLRGRVRLALDTARVDVVPISDGLLVAWVESGVARIDSLFVEAAGLVLEGDGLFGLIPGRTGTLALTARAQSLEPWEPILVGARETPMLDGRRDPLRPRIAGAVDGTATLTGSITGFDAEADLRLDHPVFRELHSATARVRVAGEGIGGDAAAYRLAASADSVRPFGWALDSAAVSAELRGGIGAVTADGWTGAGQVVHASAALARDDVDNLDVRLDELTAGPPVERWVLNRPVELELDGSALHVGAAELQRADGIGSAIAGGLLAWGSDGVREQDFTIELRGLDFADLSRLARLGESGPFSSGRVEGRLRVTGTPMAPVITGDLAVGALRYGELELDRVSAHIAYADARLRADAEAFSGERRIAHANGVIPIDLRFAAVEDRRGGAPLEFAIQADSLPAALGLGMLDGFREIEGVIEGSLTASGTLREPSFTGTLAIVRGAATWDAVGVRYESVAGTVVLREGRSAEIDIAARAIDPRERTGGGARPAGRTRAGAPPGGTARVTGTVDLSQPGDPLFALDIIADRLLAARRTDVDLTMSGTLRLGGRYTRPVLGGQMQIDGGNLYLDELYRQYQVVGLDESLLLNAVDTSIVAVRPLLPASENPFLKNMWVENVAVRVGTDSWLRSREMDVEVAGDLTVDFDRQREGQEDLRLTGTLLAVRGSYRFDYPPFSRIFEVRDGTVEFLGTPGIDPNLDIRAAYRARTQNEPLEIVAVLGGTLQNPRIRLTSDAEPPISESDLASYLFFGAPTYAFNLSSGGALGGAPAPGGPDELGTVGRGLEAALNAYGFGYFASGLQTVAQSFGLVDYVGLTAAETVAGDRGVGIAGLLAGTEIEVGRYLAPNLYAAFTQRLRSPTRTPGVRLEWRFHPTYSMELFTEDRFARAPTIGFAESVEPKKVFGFFLFREWGY